MGKFNAVTGQNAVFAYLQKHPGMVFTQETLRDDMGLAESDYDHSAAGSLGKSLAILAKKGLVERVALGKYLYRKSPQTPVPTPVVKPVAGNLFEAIGLRKSTGNVIVKDVDNNLYELHEL